MKFLDYKERASYTVLRTENYVYYFPYAKAELFSDKEIIYDWQRTFNSKHFLKFHKLGQLICAKRCNVYSEFLEQRTEIKINDFTLLELEYCLMVIERILDKQFLKLYHNSKQLELFFYKEISSYSVKFSNEQKVFISELINELCSLMLFTINYLNKNNIKYFSLYFDLNMGNWGFINNKFYIFDALAISIV